MPRADETLPEIPDAFIDDVGEGVDAFADPTARILTTPPRERLGDRLVRRGLVTPEALREAMNLQRKQGGRLGQVLVQLGHITEAVLGRELSESLGIRLHQPERIVPGADVFSLLPLTLVKRYETIPIGKEEGALVVGMVDPTNLMAVDDIRFATGFSEIRIRLITESVFKAFLEAAGGAMPRVDELPVAGEEPTFDPMDLGSDVELEQVETGGDEALVHQLQTEASLPPVVRLVNYVLLEALKKKASDIHCEPYEKQFRIRFRMDGHLHPFLFPPLRLHQAFISRLKILSSMDISVRRLPQDGHMALRHGDAVSHFRVSMLPMVYGEKCVIRLMEKEAKLADIDQLGFDEDQLRKVKRASALSQGIVLVTGPTGSGKTTTIHAIIHHINNPGTNIVTLEDPVEATIPGVNHVQVEPKGGVTFATGLRSILRQDPDVVFVGEMRDEEVSRIAVKAALTGHLVLSTLHTNGAVETISRLMDMNIEPYLIASSLRLIVAQRLLRRVCRKCAREEPIPPEFMEEFNIGFEDLAGAAAVHRVPVGCEDCLQSGYRGRVAVYEVLATDDNLRKVLRKGGEEQALFDAAVATGMLPMGDAGKRLALAGVTSFAEVRRILASE